MSVKRLLAPLAVLGIVAATVLGLAPGGPRPDVAKADTLTNPVDAFRIGVSPSHSILWQTQAQIDADLDALAGIGVQWLRLDLDWPSIEPIRGQRRWETTDAVVRAAYSRGINVLAMPAYTPAWARPAGTTSKSPPTDYAAWSSFVAEIASRYRSAGLRAFEIWNEPNTSAFWEPLPDPVAYARVLAVAANAIRAANPDAYIVTAGLAPTTDRTDRATISPATFVSRMYDAGAKPYFDGVGMHPYSFPAMPLELNDWNPFINLTQLRQVMVDKGDSYKRVWATEYGFPSVGPTPDFNEERQRLALDEAMRAWSSVSWTGVIFWHTNRDQASANPFVARLGVRNSDGSPKLAWNHLASLLAGG